MLKKEKSLKHGGRALSFPGRYLPLHIMPAGCGFQREDSCRYRWHGLQRGTREFCLWQYTLSGHGALNYEGEEYRVIPGQALLLHIPHDHCYYLPEDAECWEFIYINLNGREALRIWRELETRNGPIGNFAEDSQTVKSALNILRKSKSGRIATPFLASRLAYDFLMTMIDELPSPTNAREPVWLPDVIQFCQQHYHDDIGVDEMAAAAGFSRFHFSREFTRSQAISPGAFLRNLRLQHAVRLLQTERLTIKEVAHRCGFRDSSYFCKVFRQEFNSSPEAFRRGERRNSDM